MNIEEKKKRQRFDVWALDEEFFNLATGKHGMSLDVKEIAKKYKVNGSRVYRGINRHRKKLHPDKDKVSLKEGIRKYAKIHFPCDICITRFCEQIGSVEYDKIKKHGCPIVDSWLAKVEPAKSLGNGAIRYLEDFELTSQSTGNSLFANFI